MSEREVPNNSGSQDTNNEERASSSQPMPTGSRYNASEPIQFRVRGSTITGASPPNSVTLEDIMKAAHGMQNMAIVHEIAFDKDFKLEPFEPPDNSVHKVVKETMHRAFFAVLREQLNSDPPEYKQAIILLEEVKQGLLSLLPPHQNRIKELIEETLDTDFIKQQTENKSLDFDKYAKFVIDLMSKLAAPVRDEMIQNITTLTDTVDIFKAILETLELMKLDLANTLIAMIRPQVMKDGVQYERHKFDEILKVSEDGLQHTKAWLKRNIDKSGLSLPVMDQNIIRNVTAQTLSKAYIELLEWDGTKEYPETVSLDAPRFAELGTQVYRLIVVASLMLVSPSANASDPNIVAQHKQTLKEKLFIIIDNASNDTELKAVLPSVAEEVILVTDQLLKRMNQEPLNTETKDFIRNQIVALSDSDHRVRNIVRYRVLQFLTNVLVSGGDSQMLSVGLTALANELTTISGTLFRYVMHNKAVHAIHYLDIIAEELSTT